MTRTQAEHYHYMSDAMRRLEWDLHHTIEATSRIPPEWHEIAKSRAPRRKTRVTITLEEDVLRFFKSMGMGHGPRMNEVLRTYMHARLAGVIHGPETSAWARRQADYHDGPRPGWGDTARLTGEELAADPDDLRREAEDAVQARIRLSQADR
ncbi:MAG: hypothetical protein RIT14_1618 [Pseudomonadota bacterium]